VNEIVISIFRELKPTQQPQEQKRTDKKTGKCLGLLILWGKSDLKSQGNITKPHT